jgi:hypothetical protein
MLREVLFLVEKKAIRAEWSCNGGQEDGTIRALGQ